MIGNDRQENAQAGRRAAPGSSHDTHRPCPAPGHIIHLRYELMELQDRVKTEGAREGSTERAREEKNGH